MREWRVIEADVLAALAEMPDASFDAALCDPPYGLTANKRGGTGTASVNLNSPAGLSRVSTGNGAGGFMGMRWDAGVPGVDVWAEVLRVLKPGAHLIAFGGTRTFHRLTCAIEDAGFEIRDCLSWLYGQGFPKSLNLGDGYGTALKPSWEPAVLAMKPCSGTFAQNAIAHDVAGLNIDGGRLLSRGDGPARDGEASAERRYADRGVTSFAAKPGPRGGSPLGRWPANVALDEAAAALLDAQSGELQSGFMAAGTQREGGYRGGLGTTVANDTLGDRGGASRFFYCAKAGPNERHVGTERNHHPTVKPIDLCRWLATLLLPPQRETPRRLLVPFAGSGSEMIGALRAGWESVTGIERESDYCAIARERIYADAPLLNRTEATA